MNLKIETGDKNEILRTKSTPIQENEIKKYLPLGREMLKWIKENENACGLAAPQVGHNKRMIAVHLFNSEGNIARSLLMINPEIQKTSETMVPGEEGCFSLPETYGEVDRSEWIQVRFQNESGKKVELLLSDFSARVVQHEIDHLNGVLFTDRSIKNTK